MSHGELHVIITAKKGWMPNPAVTSVVSALAATFRQQVKDKKPGEYTSREVYQQADFAGDLRSVAEVKGVGVRFNGPHLEAEVLLDKPVMRVTAPGVDPTDYTVTFRCEWTGPEYERQETDRESRIKQAAERIRSASR